MHLKVFVLCYLLQLNLGRCSLHSRSFITEQRNGDCHDFVAPVSYPLAWRNESIIETRHGLKIHDPYRWLENPYSDQTEQFVSAQNKLSDSYLKNCDAWQRIHTKLTGIYNYKKYTLPQYHGNHYYFQMNTGLQHQSVYYRTKSLDEQPSVFLDPNEMSTDGTVAITGLVFSPDSKMAAYTFSKSGSDWNKLKIRNIKTDGEFPETLEGLKFATISWTSDSKGFFYSRYPNVGDGTETDLLLNLKVYYHRVGDSQKKDVLAFEFPELPSSVMLPTVFGKYLIMLFYPNGYPYQHHLYYVDLEKHGEIRGKIPLTPVYTTDLSSEFYFVTMVGSKAIYRTNRNAPNFRLVVIDLENPGEEDWTTLIKENPDDVLHQAFQVSNDTLLIVYLHDVKSILQLHSLVTGELIRKQSIGMKTVSGLSIDKTQTKLFIQLNSFLSPGTVYRYSLTDPNAKPTLFYEMKPNIKGFDRKNFEVKQVFYPSSDGTKIPMFIVQKLTTKNKPGPKPTLLYGYGGFGASILPSFELNWLLFVNYFEGILAVANIRGGGEYGKKWKLDGILLNKQKAFNDFHAAAEYLIKNQYTTSSKLAINGASNGGLLVGACINQRPSLYGAAVSRVGVYDMIRYNLFTIGNITMPENGSPDETVHFKNILSYSPLHNVHNSQYPPTLIQSSDHDDRVSPLHSYKFTAELQHAVEGNKNQKGPILMSILKDAGHDAGKPTYKLINQECEMLTFIYRALSIKVDF